MDFSFDQKNENTPTPIPNKAAKPANFLNSKTLIIGKRGTGKTTTVRDIYKQIQNELNEVHIFSNGSESSLYEDISNAIYTDFTLLEDFTYYCKTNQSNKLLIIENICDGKQLNLLEEVLYKNRSMNVTVIITAQYSIGIKAEYRAQFDYVFAANEDFYSSKQRLYQHYFGMYPTLAMFCQILDSLDKFQFLCSNGEIYQPMSSHLVEDYRFIQTKTIEKGNNKKTRLIKQVNETIESLIKMRDLLNDLL